jgi:exodeoxyribonuclease VII small subunit
MSTASFEENLKQLEQLISQLERTELPLDKAMEAFENGTKLVAVCKEQLAQVEMKVEKIMARTAPAADELNLE